MDNAALMEMRAALLETTATRGWSFFAKFAETIVRELESEAIAEEDDARAAGLRRDARGARRFKDELFKRVQIVRTQEPHEFLEVATD